MRGRLLEWQQQLSSLRRSGGRRSLRRLRSLSASSAGRVGAAAASRRVRHAVGGSSSLGIRVIARRVLAGFGGGCGGRRVLFLLPPRPQQAQYLCRTGRPPGSSGGLLSVRVLHSELGALLAPFGTPESASRCPTSASEERASHPRRDRRSAAGLRQRQSRSQDRPRMAGRVVAGERRQEQLEGLAARGGDERRGIVMSIFIFVAFS